MKKSQLLAILFGFMLLATSCTKDTVTEKEQSTETETEPSELDIENLTIPEGFDFSTQQEVKITINDNTDYVKYDVYAYSNEKYFQGMETYENEAGETETDSIFTTDILDKLLFTGVSYNGKLSHTITLPTYYDQVYILRNEKLKYSSSIESISGSQVNYNYYETSGKSSATTIVEDFLYCVNGEAELFQVDPLTGDKTYLSDMPMGSWTAAIDQTNKVMYSIGRSSPYPLMKYYIETNTWEEVGNVEKGGPRLAYNDNDELLYFSNKDFINVYDPSNGNTLSTWDIEGLDNTSGGDLAFADDGTLFMCTFSGLYELELDSDNVYQATRISADDLPFTPTSMTFDSNQELWLSENSNEADLIIMDTETGGWEYRYGASANNNTDLGSGINDLATFRIYSETDEDIDTDGDGIIDINDEYPDDAEKAFETYTPSKYGWGTVAFEDLWPSSGDYDFNDLAINYQVIAVLNSENLAVQVDFIYNVKATGGSYVNGFGIEIEGLTSDQIESVTGTVLTQDYINENTNGTEVGQENAVIILFDNMHTREDIETTVSISFTEPISTEELGTAPFNPFMIINKIREKEVHLPYGHTTSLGSNIFEIEGVNKDSDGDYATDTGLPWAINIVHDFKVPTEKTAVDEAYNFFDAWATSGGTSYDDWYKDSDGYRNDNLIDD